jgi:type I restriction enzyme S subunit
VSLGDICEFKYGRSLAAADRRPGAVPVYGSNGQVGNHDEALTQGPTVIVGRKGSLGKVAFSEKPCWPIDTTYYVDATATAADLRWLAYRLDGLGLTALNRAAAVPGLNREDAYRKELLLPPLREQRKIAAILDQAAALRARRQAALDASDELVAAIFRGLVVHHPERARWPSRSVAQLAASHTGAIRTGPFGSQLLHSEFTESGVAVLGIDNAVADEFRWGKPRFISEAKYAQLKRYTVHPGDVLITIMGTCGRCAVVPDNIPVAINTKHLCCITLDRAQCSPTFLWAAFRFDPECRSYLHRHAKGAVMDGLNMGIIKSLPVRIPPLPVQEAFARAVGAAHAVRAAQRASVDELDSLFAALVDRAFKGEL